ncbi:MAG: Tol-Pal system protein TolB, partial [Hyphomicrobiales bacterium]|nr:Tol-Pal system protein TolB [Hyphomicrobiales bacterium]
MKTSRLAGLVTFVCMSLAASGAFAQTEINITEGRIAATPIAVSTFLGSTEREAELARDITEVVRADLNSSDLFTSIEERRFRERIDSPNSLPDFEAWRSINAQALVTGRVSDVSEETIRIEFRLWDIFAAKQLFGLQLSTQREYWRRLAHIVADKVYERLSGESGYFDSKVAFISETGSKGARQKEIIIMDQDGNNARAFSDKGLILTPRFSPTGEEVVYLSYEDGTPRV